MCDRRRIQLDEEKKVEPMPSTKSEPAADEKSEPKVAVKARAIRSETVGATPTTETIVDVFTPRGIQLFIGLYWAAGLSGIMLGTLSINQGFFERYYDTQILLVIQGSAIATLGGAMFIIATGMVSGANWGLQTAKRVAAFSVVWSAVGISLAAYSAYNLPGLSYSVILYGIIVWLIIFGVLMGSFGVRYLYAETAAIQRYSEYVTTDTVVEGEMQPKYLPQYDDALVRPALPPTGRGTYCWNCGGSVGENWVSCPRCGARMGADRVVG